MVAQWLELASIARDQKAAGSIPLWGSEHFSEFRYTISLISKQLVYLYTT